MGMAWFKFYTYIVLPLGIMSYIARLMNISFSFHSFYFNITPYPDAIPEFVFTMIGVLTIIPGIILVIGLHFKKLWAWKFNIFSLAWFTATTNLYIYTNIQMYVCGILLATALWLIPNYFYFLRRRTMFI